MHPYICVACGGSLVLDDSELNCPGCSRGYPVVAGIPILTLRPATLLSFARAEIQAEAAVIADLARAAGETAAADPARLLFQQRVAQAVHGTQANFQLIAEYTRPLNNLPQTPRQAPGLIDAVSGWGAGWSSTEMLPYFFQDWGNTADFAAVRDLLREAVLELRPDRRAIAVLGSGACGLLHALGAVFDSAIGIDLSVTTLLLACGVLRGDRIVVHIDKADWQAVELQSATPSAAHIQTAVADVAALPLASGSMSVVVTQYLMDIVGNPRRVTDEIERVLAPGGVWVNFSAPFRIPSDPDSFGRFALEELAEFLAGTQLLTLRSQLQPFKLLNLETLSRRPAIYQHSVHFFAARRACRISNARLDSQRPGALTEFRNDWWRCVPRFARGRRARIIATTELTGEMQRKWLVGFGLEGFRTFHASREHARSILRLLRLVDGKRSSAEILTRWNERGMQLAPGDFPELLHYLSDRHGLLTLA